MELVIVFERYNYTCNLVEKVLSRWFWTFRIIYLKRIKICEAIMPNVCNAQNIIEKQKQF